MCCQIPNRFTLNSQMIFGVWSNDNFLSPLYSSWSILANKVWSMLHHGSVSRVQSKECCFMFIHAFLTFLLLLLLMLLLFFIKKFVFIIYHFRFFFDEESNFRNRILTNHKSELVMKNCQWNCMLVSDEIDKRYLICKLEQLENYC